MDAAQMASELEKKVIDRAEATITNTIDHAIDKAIGRIEHAVNNAIDRAIDGAADRVEHAVTDLASHRPSGQQRRGDGQDGARRVAAPMP